MRHEQEQRPAEEYVYQKPGYTYNFIHVWCASSVYIASIFIFKVVIGNNGDEEFGGGGVWWDQLPYETYLTLHTGQSKTAGKE